MSCTALAVRLVRPCSKDVSRSTYKQVGTQDMLTA